MGISEDRYARARLVAIVAGVLAMVVRLAIVSAWPTDSRVPPTFVSTPVALLVLNCGMAIVYRMSRATAPDGTALWGKRARRAIVVGWSIVVVLSLLGLGIMVREYVALRRWQPRALLEQLAENPSRRVREAARERLGEQARK